VKQVPRY